MHRKNERRTAHSLPVQIPLQDAGSFTPSSTFEDVPSESLAMLHTEITACLKVGGHIVSVKKVTIACMSCMQKKFSGWFDATSLSAQGSLVFCKLDDTSDVQYSLKINPDLFWTLHSFRRPIDTSACSMLQHVPPLLTTVASVKAVVKSLQRCIVCAGNEDTKFFGAGNSPQWASMICLVSTNR